MQRLGLPRVRNITDRSGSTRRRYGEGRRKPMSYLEYSPVIDTVLIVALCVIVWGAYRELRAARVRALTRDKA